jgi:outer membrane protein TolC
MRLWIVLFLLIFLPLHAQQELTAEEAIRIGLENNYSIRIARNNVEIAQNNKGKGTAGFLPVLNTTGGYQHANSRQETNSPFSFGNSDTRSLNGQVSLNWTLFDGFAMFIANSQYRELAKLGEYQARNLIENTVVQILSAYFNLVQQEQLLDVARNARDISRTRLEKERVRRELGSASSTDFLNAQVSFNQDQATLLNQELRTIIARKDLNIFLAQNPDTPIEVKKEIVIPPLELTFEEMLQMAEERNSTLMVARQNKLVADQNVKLSYRPFMPQLSLLASYGYSDRTVSSDSPRFSEDVETQSKDGIVGLNLSFNLFNGFRDKINLQNARIVAKNQALVLADVRNQLGGVMRETYETFNKRVELSELEQQNVAAAQQNLDLQRDRYQIGAATSLEFRDAQVNLIRARTTLIVARYQARITRLELEQLSGRWALESIVK